MDGRTKEAERADGLLLAPIGDGGTWAAIRALRSGMRRVTGGTAPRAAFLTAISGEGRVVTQDDPRASVLVLGYRTDED